ncbi:replication initiation protein [Gracilibacillus boraciitolerans]|uniref:replication initiation protein n=1 Tax=Gracilibacillus boraciitolerans TaxID=307521 RepID=UPI00130DF78A|nr:replication initiation protein [Gracilibacillus boraciitolerans]
MKKQNQMVVQSNNLVEAYYDSDLTATEHKIIRYAASKIKSNPDQFPTVSFDVKEFMRAGGLKGNAYHKKIEIIGDELSGKRIKIQNDQKIGWFPWLSSLVYDNGTIYLSFNTLIKDLLLELEGQFTKYNYQYIGDMRSSYSIRLYELLKQYAPIGKRRFDLLVLKKMLGVDGKYKGYGQFKQRVLNQAKKELDRKGKLIFSFEEIKQGRQVKEIVFFIQVHEEQLS